MCVLLVNGCSATKTEIAVKVLDFISDGGKSNVITTTMVLIWLILKRFISILLTFLTTTVYFEII